MSNSSVTKTNIYGKTIFAAILEFAIIISFYALFFSNIDFDPVRKLTTILLIAFPFVISICTGFVIASIADTKHLSGWKWGAVASAMNLFMIIILVSLPSFLSGMAFIIAPLVAIAICFNLINAQEANTQE